MTENHEDAICPECGDPFLCPTCLAPMVHHDMFGMAWCENIYFRGAHEGS